MNKATPYRNNYRGFEDREMSTASSSTMRQYAWPRRQSTETLRNESEGIFVDEDDAMDVDLAEHMAADVEEPKRPIILATDFGTTFSAAAYAPVGPYHNTRIKIVAGYPEDPGTLSGKPALEVPTESWYPDKSQMAEEAQEMEMANANDTAFNDLYDVSDPEDSQRFEDEQQNEYEIPDSIVSGIDSEIPDFFWGYGIQKLTVPDMDHSKFNRISRSKLLLDVSDHTQQVRNDLRPILTRLKRAKVIKKDEDVIADYLTHFFLHAKRQLRLDGIFHTDLVQHVLCVPIVWSSKALRTMQRAMETAIRKSALGSLENLFFVSEPEAAAAYVLGRSDEVSAGEAFLILDAGGGTVDATTFMVTQDSPLRLQHELVKAKGCLHGSSYLNEGFRKHLLERLKDETYLEQHGFTINGMVDVEVLQFERKIKRTMDVTNPRMLVEAVIFQGLRPDAQKRFGANRVLINRNDFLQIFSPHLEAIGKLMTDQLLGARAAGYRVQKVVLIGGFSGSPSLRNHLKLELKRVSQAMRFKIRLIDAVDSESPETAVAYGAVLRAQNKENGPDRISRSSYGFLRTEVHYPALFPEHVGIRPSIDKLDGLRYVRDTIDWLVKQGTDVPHRAEYKIRANHTFNTKRKTFKCEEVLFVSEECTESHYRVTHEKNKGKVEKVGTIIIDMAPLVAQGKVKIKYPKPGYVGEPHYKFKFDLVMTIEGRNLSFEARWPAGKPLQVKSHGQISIAAAFEPGTD